MGLIKAGMGALGGTLADQWKEYFYCEAMDRDVMVVKGQKRTSSRSSNTKGNDNIISNGSVIAVADGQCMMIVEQGQIRGRSLRSVQNPVNLHMTRPQNPVFFPEILETTFGSLSKQLESVSPLAAIQQRINEFITSIRRS